jgi:hypothetical protein
METETQGAVHDCNVMEAIGNSPAISVLEIGANLLVVWKLGFGTQLR